MTNKEIYENIRKLCKENGTSVTALEAELGFSRGSLGKMRTAIRKPDLGRLEKIAKKFDVHMTEICGTDFEQSKNKTVIKIPHTDMSDRIHKEMSEGIMSAITGQFSGNSDLRISKKIPVLGRVAAGLPIVAEEEILDWEEISGEMALNGEYFALQIKGDSMEPRMESGDVVIVRQQEDADSGDYVIALVNGDDAVCKKLMKYEDGSIALVSLNPAYKPMYFSGAEIDSTPVRIIGRVMELRGKM